MPILAIYALVITTTFAAGFTSGYKVKGNYDTLQFAKQLQVELEKQDKQVKVVHEVEKIYLDKAAEIKTVYKTVTKETIKYVPKIQIINSECNLTIGTVRLLNANARNKVPATAGSTDPTNTESSTITGRKFIEYTNEIIHKYHRVKTQCDGLIDYTKQIAEVTK